MFKKILLLFLFLIPCDSCSDDFEIKEFEQQFNKNFLEKEKWIPSPILIGDSKVSGLKSTKGFKKSLFKIGYNKSGINTQQLINGLKTSAIDTTINCVFVSIGTNDGYTGNYAKQLKSAILSKYPKTKRFWIIWGSIGWGSIKNKTRQDQLLFYKRFESEGFNQIQIENTFIPTDTQAHTPNNKYYQEVIKKINKILQ